MDRTLRILLPAALACIAAVRSGAQTPPAPAAAPAKLVTIGVVALNERGQTIDDLKAADFQVSDAGKPQKITIFHRRGGKARPADATGPGQYSNRSASNVPRATVVLFDMFNEDANVQGSVADLLARSLQPLESADYLYLYFLTPEPRLYPVHALPGSEGAGGAAPGAPWTKNAKALIEQAIKKSYKLRPPEIRIDERIRMTHRALERMGGVLAAVPGRKALVWVTHGVPVSLGSGFDTIDYEPWFRRLGLSFARSGIAVHPVQQGGSSNAGYIALRSQDTLRLVSEMTGGAKMTDNIEAAVRQAMSEARSNYVIGYEPPADNWDGAFHKLLLTCERKGVRLQTVAGYDASEQTAASEQASLDAALGAAFDAADVGIRGTVSADPPGEGGGRMTHFEFRIDARDLQLAKAGNQYTLRLALQFAGFMQDGKAERLRPVPLDLAVSEPDYQKLLAEGIPFKRDILLGSSLRKMRMAVLDRGSHAVGALTVTMPWAK